MTTHLLFETVNDEENGATSLGATQEMSFHKHLQNMRWNRFPGTKTTSYFKSCLMASPRRYGFKSLSSLRMLDFHGIFSSNHLASVARSM